MITSRDVILGIYQGFNAVASLLVGGEPAVTVEKERITRRKHARGAVDDCVERCLEFAGLSIDEVDEIAFCGASDLDTDYGYDIVSDGAGGFPASGAARLLGTECWRAMRVRVLGRILPAVLVEHHVAHGAAAFFTSGLDRALVVAYDGMGDFGRSCLVMRGTGSRLECLESVPLRIGLAFRKAGVHLYRLQGSGLDAAGKLMALAALGEPRHLDAAEFLLGTVSRRTGRTDLTLPGLGRVEAGALSDLDGPLARDFAASLQEAASRAARALLRKWLRPGEDLCLSGGVALNVIVNRDILRDLPVGAFHVPPFPHDGGLGLGAALYLRNQIRERPTAVRRLPPYLGATDVSRCDATDLAALAAEGADRIAIRELDGHRAVAAACELLARGEVVGWCQGRPEAGPRALGNRSYLADPSLSWIAAHLNRRVKHREPFRPYGLSLREENVDRVMPGARRSPYMMMAGSLDAAWRQRLPAAVHVDGTTRYHTVRHEDNPLFWELLRRFEERSGIPALVNTSFNSQGEPIAETAADCVATFRDTAIDHLFLGRLHLSKLRG